MNSKVDVSVSNDDVSSLGKGRDDRRDRRECLRVKNSILRSKEISNTFLQYGVNVDGSIETCWTATSETVFAKGFSCLLFDMVVARKAGEVEAGEVHDGLARPNKLRFRTCGTADDRERRKVQALSLSKRLFKWLWGPFVNEFVDFLVMTYQSRHRANRA